MKERNQSDPGTRARHNFDYQMNQLLSNFLLSDAAPLGKIADWFYRAEYQQRSSPHIRKLIWLENAPRFGSDSDEKVIGFVKKVINCQKPTDNSELLLNLSTDQYIYRHSRTCRKQSKTECRFNYPQPPMRATTILYPVDVEEEDQTQLKQLKDAKKQLNDMKEGEDITFEQLLLNLNVSEETHLLAIRSMGRQSGHKC